MVVGVYERWTCVQLAFQRERATWGGGKKKKKEEETNVKMWGTTSAKVGMAGETKGSGWHGVKVATWHGQWGRVG